MTKKEKPPFRSSACSVTRSVLTDDGWKQIATYHDADVEGGDKNNIIGSDKTATLRIYHSDLDHYSEEYQHGNGLRVDPKTGAIMDCDSDLQVERIRMDGVLGSHDWGQCRKEYTGVVSFTEETAWGSGSRAVNEWKGRGNYEKLRIECWSVRLVKDN